MSTLLLNFICQWPTLCSFLCQESSLKYMIGSDSNDISIPPSQNKSRRERLSFVQDTAKKTNLAFKQMDQPYRPLALKKMLITLIYATLKAF
ncbi:hypothetical protein Plhal304r1_c010g0040591 [Plasmopara halstedii]